MVNLIVKCLQDQADVSVKPWLQHIKQGESVTFRLQGGANAVSQVTLRPKSGAANPKHWPFASGPIVLKQGEQAVTDPSPSVDQRYPYEIFAQCKFVAGGETLTSDIVVDPEIVVKGV